MIKAVILAAGLGTRLRELITDKPKCMVHVNGRPIIGWQISALLSAGLRDIAVVTGYHAAVLQEYVARAFPGVAITFIHSERFAETNNMFSLWIARQHVGNADLLFMNADVAFDPTIIVRLIEPGNTAVAVDEGSYNEESMKVTRPAGSEFLNAISKQINQLSALGSSIDVYFLRSPDAKILFDECENIIQKEGQCRQWTELALHRLLETGRLAMRSVNINGLNWYEIDNPADLTTAETIFTAASLKRSRPKAYFIDLDGTIYLGGRNIEQSDLFIRHIRAEGAKVVFLSNNSSKSHSDYVKRLALAGIAATEDEILLSTDALGVHLQSEGITCAYVLGTTSMKCVLARYGIIHGENDPKAVVVGYHNEVHYSELARASLLLQNQAVAYYASHADKVCPTEHGPIPDAGALCELLYVATGRRPGRTFGKPSADYVQTHLALLGVRKEDAVVIGDRIYTDLALAKAANIKFIGVLSGECTRSDFEGQCDIMIASTLGSLAQLIGSAPSGAPLPNEIKSTA